MQCLYSVVPTVLTFEESVSSIRLLPSSAPLSTDMRTSNNASPTNPSWAAKHRDDCSRSDYFARNCTVACGRQCRTSLNTARNDLAATGPYSRPRGMLASSRPAVNPYSPHRAASYDFADALCSRSYDADVSGRCSIRSIRRIACTVRCISGQPVWEYICNGFSGRGRRIGLFL